MGEDICEGDVRGDGVASDAAEGLDGCAEVLAEQFGGEVGVHGLPGLSEGVVCLLEGVQVAGVVDDGLAGLHLGQVGGLIDGFYERVDALSRFGGDKEFGGRRSCGGMLGRGDQIGFGAQVEEGRGR